MNAELAKLIADSEAVADKARAAFGNFSAEKLNWKPDAKTWSIGQCFEHLIVTNELYFPAIQAVIDGEHRNNLFSKIPFSTDIIAALMKNSLKPEQKRKMKTFKVFEPSASNVSPAIIEDFATNNRKLIEMIEACKDFDLHKIKIAEPLSVTLNLRLDDAFEILIMHEKRHFKQAERVFEQVKSAK